jgi:hypothetical protein
MLEAAQVTVPFSQRHGYTQSKVPLKAGQMDDETRVRLWNVLWAHVWTSLPQDFGSRSNWALLIARRVWDGFLKRPYDEMPTTRYEFYEEMKSTFNGRAWYQLCDLIEFVVLAMAEAREWDRISSFMRECDDVLKSELAGYRMVDGHVVPVTTEDEVAAIERATAIPIDLVRAHIRQAVELFSKRPVGDHRNSIKESISAVEAMCSRIVGSRATLGDALKKLEQSGIKVHPAMRSAFSSLYGWTSDDGGIRHALTEDGADVGVAESRFMLVSCSAFVNLLLEKCTEARLKLA